jgi:hypothetical protein
MKIALYLILISILMMVAAPAWSDSALHAITCEQDEETTDEQVEAISADNYPGSAAEAIDDKYEDDLDCGNGTLWESVKVE